MEIPVSAQALTFAQGALLGLGLCLAYDLLRALRQLCPRTGLAADALFGLLPGLLGDVLSQIPFLAVGVPAITSIYFDWFSGAMQAFIFCMLTTMYIANAAEAD